MKKLMLAVFVSILLLSSAVPLFGWNPCHCDWARIHCYVNAEDLGRKYTIDCGDFPVEQEGCDLIKTCHPKSAGEWLVYECYQKFTHCCSTTWAEPSPFVHDPTSPNRCNYSVWPWP
jgi:hypothetical protein